MKITDAKIIVCCPGRNFVTLKIFTDEGIYGLGDATLNGREKAVATYLQEYCLPSLIGRHPFQIEDIWHFFYRGAYWRRGPVTMTAIAAIDMALWDIKGKALNTPVYNLIGGKSRKKVLVYAHAEGRDIEEAVDSVGERKDQGFLAVRAQCGVPGLDDIYGVSKDNKPYEPAAQGLPKENLWDTAKYLNHVPKLFRRLRDVYGQDLHLLHDAHHRCTPIEAARLAKELEPFHLFWLEDVVTGELQESYRIVRQHSTTPLAIGEVFNSIYDYSTFITEHLIDYLRMPIVHGGGISHVLKVAAVASVFHISTGFHGATDLSPVNMAASLHVNYAINNFGIQELMPHNPIVNEVFKINYYFDSGYLLIKKTPGLGVDIDEDAAKKFPYKRAFLPFNRKTDGTLFHW